MRFFRDIRKYSHYIIFATKSQLRSEVANSYLNWIWWILEPFCNMVVYTIIFGYVFHARETYFPVFVFIGISMWSFFSKTLNASVKLIKHNKSIITRVYIPKQILLIKLMFVNFFKMSLAFAIILVMLLIYRIKINICVLYIIPSVMVLFMLTYGIGCFLMHFGVFVEDLAYVVSILLHMVMYFTGVFYSVDRRIPPPFGKLLAWGNPVACMINITRNALLYRKGSVQLPLLFWFGFSMLLSIIGTRLIYKNENNYVKTI